MKFFVFALFAILAITSAYAGVIGVPTAIGISPLGIGAIGVAPTGLISTTGLGLGLGKGIIIG